MNEHIYYTFLSPASCRTVLSQGKLVVIHDFKANTITVCSISQTHDQCKPSAVFATVRIRQKNIFFMLHSESKFNKWLVQILEMTSCFGECVARLQMIN